MKSELRTNLKSIIWLVKKFVVGSFDDEAVLFPAVKKVRKAGYKSMMYLLLSRFTDWIRQWDCVIPACILPDLFMRITGTATALVLLPGHLPMTGH